MQERRLFLSNFMLGFKRDDPGRMGLLRTGLSDYGRLHCESRKREEGAVKMQQPQLIEIMFTLEHDEATSIIFQDNDRDIG
jgi:hypothetical protein